MILLEKIKEDFNRLADVRKSGFLQKFFKAIPAGYGEGDMFLGVSVPAQRSIARRYFRVISHGETEILLRGIYHEYRLTAIFILVMKFENSKSEKERNAIAGLYLDNIDFINNWDLVDSSAYKILGPWLLNRERDLLFEMAESDNLWKQRIAIITTLHFIRNGQYDDTLNLAGKLLNHDHDLIHKAVGWMLREICKRDPETGKNFLMKHYRQMPRTMLRYAIEKFDEDLRQEFLKGTYQQQQAYRNPNGLN
jgi:3-methyladenine DNA glycosylase AlkD